MSIPTPLLLLYLVLIGWPLLQLISVLMARRPRARRNALVQELLADSHFNEAEREEIRTEEEISRAGLRTGYIFTIVPLTLVPLTVPFELIGDIFLVLTGRCNAPEEPVQYLKSKGLAGDARFKELQRVTVQIAWLRRPVTSILAFFLIALILPFLVLSYGINGTLEMIAASTDRVGRSAIHS